jgi:RHS repeat-associated protein
LDAYFVTASANGAESLRSNTIFWKAGGPNDGYDAQLIPSNSNPAEIDPNLELLACLDSPGETIALALEERSPSESLVSLASSSSLATSPMLRLGSVADPPWQILNLHTDHLGTVRLVTDNASTLTVSRHDYFPFGEDIAPMTSYNMHQYTGHERDKESGLDYMLARFYDNSVARFTSVDPSQESASPAGPQSWNRYAYVLGNPLNLTDPDGQDPFLCARPGHETSSTWEHMFAVYGAQYLGDPGATVRSFGDTGNDTMGEVTNETLGTSDGTSSSDRIAWLSLSLIWSNDPKISCNPVPGTDRAAAANADDIAGGTQEYSLVPAIEGGVNSNSAAQAWANRTAGKPVPRPGRLVAPGREAADRVKFKSDEEKKKEQKNKSGSISLSSKFSGSLAGQAPKVQVGGASQTDVLTGH